MDKDVFAGAVEKRKKSQEKYRHKVRRFTFQFSLKDAEARAWFEQQPDKGEYLKALILADKQRCLVQSSEKISAKAEPHTLDACGSLSGCPYEEMMTPRKSAKKQSRNKSGRSR